MEIKKVLSKSKKAYSAKLVIKRLFIHLINQAQCSLIKKNHRIINIVSFEELNLKILKLPKKYFCLIVQ